MSAIRSIAEEALQILVPHLSTQIREVLEDAVDKLDSLSQGTENEYDDALVELLRSAVDYPGPSDDS